MLVDDAAMDAEEPLMHVEFAVMFGVVGVFLVLAGWAAAKGRLKRNYVIGMRTGTIMRTHETWRVAHKRCAWSIWCSGLVLLTAAGLLVVLRPPEAWTGPALLVPGGVVGALILVGASQAHKAAREVDDVAPAMAEYVGWRSRYRANRRRE